MENNKNIRLEDDLYNYVNGKWIEEAVIPSDLPATGGFMDLVQDVEKIMIDELNTLSSSTSNIEDKALNNAINLYKVINNLDKRNEGISFLLSKLKVFDDIKSVSDLKSSFITLYRNNFSLPFSFEVSSDMKDTFHHSLNLSGPSTILPDTSMYNTPSEEMLLNIYKMMVSNILTALEINDETLIPKALEFDKRISKIVKSSEEWADYIDAYNPRSREEVEKLLNFDLSSFITEIYGKNVDKIIVNDVRFLENFNTLIEDDYSYFVAWSKLRYIVRYVEFINEDLRNLSGVYGRTITGIEEMQPLDKYSYDLTNNFFDEVLGVYYGKKYFGEEAKQDVISIVKNLVETYKERLTNNKWLSKETIEKAILKLDKMEIKIGYPDKLLDIYKDMEVKDDEILIEVVDRLLTIKRNYENSKLFKDVDRSLWVMSGNTVNACYNPTSNDITFPAAILRKPFYSLDQSLEENYGGIGCVIGHEISHAFDNNGSKMDEYGNINEWWKEEDFKAFEEKTKLMIEQFDGIELYDTKVNGTLTVSENIADNGGVASSLQTVKRLKENPDLSLFFINYAKIWRQKAKEEYTKLLLTIDVHSPAILRTNVQVKNFNEFYSTFNIKEEDKMYLEPSKRIIIW